MLVRIPRSWELPEREVTDECLVMNRRQILAAGALALAGCATAKSAYPEPGRSITPEKLATTYNNFYEFSSTKELVVEKSAGMPLEPWSIAVSGECLAPQTFDIDRLRKMPHEERIYRFRCVEAWSMTVPWSGFPLRSLLELVQPTSSAKFVRFETFSRADWAPGMKLASWYPWPYSEALTIEEAMHPLALVVTGMYGKQLPRQNGAPVRLIVPWKYGFKSAKSLVRIELVEQQPKTFWNMLVPDEYGFYANVDPATYHPRWSQAKERLLEEMEELIPTLPFNGYGSEVARLYPPGKTYF